MVPHRLEPCLDLLREEYVLVQAWKKTASYIRYHNWFADTLDLDRTAVNLPAFIGELRERLRSPETWQNKPLRIVPAPKRQDWAVSDDVWEPVKKGTAAAPLRPLAHVALADQVLATALMLCLADRVETMQGDPRESLEDHESRRKVVSYGNRLFCDRDANQLHHRWGSEKLYRKYHHDYRTFASRPEVVAEPLLETNEKRLHVVHTDMRQFYDRVSPEQLTAAVTPLQREGDDASFFTLTASILDWGWDARDERTVQVYAQQAELESFERVALPQGLVASGFFANIVLLPFDEALRAAIDTEVEPGVLVADASRYTDDLQILVASDWALNASPDDSKRIVFRWLSQLLQEHAPGLDFSWEKTRVAGLGEEERPLARPSPRLDRIQSAVSGGFDAVAGEEILDAIQGLLRAQEALSIRDGSGWRFTPISDVRDETVARFGAYRYRKTFRSIRPLLYADDTSVDADTKGPVAGSRGGLRKARTRRELDEDARVFAFELVQRWTKDPSNVRLLRIGLDIWPDVKLLRKVLSLLLPFTRRADREEPREVEAQGQIARYCLAELLRAGATETGLVPDSDSLPSGVDLAEYREELGREARRLVSLDETIIPWYLREQALLFLASHDPVGAPVAANVDMSGIHYRQLILFLRGEGDQLAIETSDLATLAILARRSFLDRPRAVELIRSHLNPSLMREIARRDPSFLVEIIEAVGATPVLDDLPARVREDLGWFSDGPSDNTVTLAQAVLSTHPTGSLRNELAVLRFAMAFLEQWEKQEAPRDPITPGQIRLELTDDRGIARIQSLRIVRGQADAAGSLYQVPRWCMADAKWRHQLGFLIRFILSGQRDFTRPVRGVSWKEATSAYRPPENHWYQRLYGSMNVRGTYGDDWLPVTEWVEGLLYALLRWPGCRGTEEFNWVEQGVDEAKTHIAARIAQLEQHRGVVTGSLILPVYVKNQIDRNEKKLLRTCVVQTVRPMAGDFPKKEAVVGPGDLAFNKSTTRRAHRNHLSATLAAIERMLVLRETHKERTGGRLDWLILPELAVHPQDVDTHLIPFARTHKAMILAGLTYEELFEGKPLVNSALWVIPERSKAYGLHMRILRQGKKHLAAHERAFNCRPERALQGFRPCQWVIGYPWANTDRGRPLWLTAAVCYHATDLGLAADLRDVSDILAIPALNKDVKTFDQMALALHYHMFQLVVVANSGRYGGSNAYWPQHGAENRRVFHTHGQPQGSISFFEIDDIGAFLRRHEDARDNDWEASSERHEGSRDNVWKEPPAGLQRASPPDG